ncbi:DUF4032 domain-containing protein [Kocuria flava]|uniref:DUF4032 domain-containing protein n=1 Tax=Kocuria flava TaxID=446860 RepID=UPI002F936CD7
MKGIPDPRSPGPPAGDRPPGARVSIQTAFPDPVLLELPWEKPLEQWPEEVLVAFPRGISRHVVRFAHAGPKVVAVKETTAHYAQHEYGILRRLQRMGIPAVVPDSVVTHRYTPEGEELPAALVTDHLSFSLPYRALFSAGPRAETVERLVDALASLIVQLHLSGFYWGDVSLSNTLFRRDAGAFAAYLVDAETGELHPSLSPGQRAYDVELARTNVAGEIMDLLAGAAEEGHELADVVDPFEVSDRLVATYEFLWRELTVEESFSMDERWRVVERVRRLNRLGFDVEEASLETDDGRIRLRPQVVEPGHHTRRLQRLTGLTAHENQARRLLTDIAQLGQDLYPGLDEELVAQLWMREVFAPIMEAVPATMRRKLEPPEIVHEVLEHRWFLSERAGKDVPTPAAVRDYVASQLSTRPDEREIF